MPINFLSKPVHNLLQSLVILAIFQWIVILPIMQEAGVFSSLSCWIKGVHESSILECPQNVSDIRTIDKLVIVKPFSIDFFFWCWNIYPILLFLCYSFSSSIYSNHRERIKSRFSQHRTLEIQIINLKFRSGWPVIFVSFVISLIFVLAQLNKQQLFTRSGEFVYWWDHEISATIFYIRLFFVATNAVLVSLVLLVYAWWIYFIYNTVRLSRVQALFTDPQEVFGFRPFANFLVSLILPGFWEVYT